MAKRYQIQRRSKVRPQWEVTHDCHGEEAAREFLKWAQDTYSFSGRHTRLAIEYRLVDTNPFGHMTAQVVDGGLILT
ncbi:MAG: hypothetical protein WA154_12875 [Moraxellaceae bacterium]